MANVPADLKYTREHEWAKREGDRVRIGITAFAQEQLGDVVFVELPKTGTKVTAHQAFGVVESVKAVSDLFAPVSGEVVEVNGGLPGAPDTVNRDPAISISDSAPRLAPKPAIWSGSRRSFHAGSAKRWSSAEASASGRTACIAVYFGKFRIACSTSSASSRRTSTSRGSPWNGATTTQP